MIFNISRTYEGFEVLLPNVQINSDVSQYLVLNDKNIAKVPGIQNGLLLSNPSMHACATPKNLTNVLSGVQKLGVTAWAEEYGVDSTSVNELDIRTSSSCLALIDLRYGENYLTSTERSFVKSWFNNIVNYQIAEAGSYVDGNGDTITVSELDDDEILVKCYSALTSLSTYSYAHVASNLFRHCMAMMDTSIMTSSGSQNLLYMAIKGMTLDGTNCYLSPTIAASMISCLASQAGESEAAYWKTKTFGNLLTLFAQASESSSFKTAIANALAEAYPDYS